MARTFCSQLFFGTVASILAEAASAVGRKHVHSFFQVEEKQKHMDPELDNLFFLRSCSSAQASFLAFLSNFCVCFLLKNFKHLQRRAIWSQSLGKASEVGPKPLEATQVEPFLGREARFLLLDLSSLRDPGQRI